MLAVVQTHPIQYQAPVFRALTHRFDVPVTAIYASDFSLAGYRDKEFGATFAWDSDLLSGYSSLFLSRVKEGGAASVDEVSSRGVGDALARLHPAAVLIVGYRPHLHRAALFHAWMRGYPVLFRAETTDTEPASLVKRSTRRLALRLLYSRCDRMLYIGKRSRRHYENLGCDRARLVFSPYCTDTASFDVGEEARTRLREPLRQSLGVDPADLLVVFSGKLISKKRPDLLIEAIARLEASSDRRFAVVFLGDGELRPELEAAARAGCRARMHFVGFKNQSELSPYYHAADLLVLPSGHSETWGVVINEALSHGLPCVVSNAVGCALDLAIPGRTGETFDAGSVTGLEAAMMRAAALVNRADVREACRKLVSEYSVERAAAGIADAYRAVSQKTPRRER